MLGRLRKPLRGPAKLHPPQPGKLHLQLLQFQRLELQRLVGKTKQSLQAVGVVGKVGRWPRHVGTMPRFGRIPSSPRH